MQNFTARALSPARTWTSPLRFLEMHVRRAHDMAGIGSSKPTREHSQCHVSAYLDVPLGPLEEPRVSRQVAEEHARPRVEA